MADEEIVRNPNDAVILNYSQNPVEYQSVPKVWLTHPDSTKEEPILVPFTYGEAVSKEVAPDFSEGDMAVEIPDGELVTELTVKKPEELVPENIPEGQYIAGVGPGTFKGSGSSGGIDLYDIVMKTASEIVSPTLPYVPSSYFSGWSNLQRVDLANCSQVNQSAFYGCSNLRLVSFPRAQTVSSSAFWGCSSLESIDLPVCESVGGSAFSVCVSLRQASIPRCEQLGSYAFNSCSALLSICLPSCVSIGGGAFQYCTNLRTVEIAPGHSTIGTRWFYQCYNLQTVGPTSDVGVIRNYAFYGCSELRVLSAPNCSRVGSFAFYGANNVKFEYARPLVSVGSGAFSTSNIYVYNVSGVGGTYYSDIMIKWTATAKNAMDGVKTIAGYVFGSTALNMSSYWKTLPSTVEYISPYAFYKQTNLQLGLGAPNNLKSIGDYAFYSCDYMGYITIEAPECTYLGDYAFYKGSARSYGPKVVRTPKASYVGTSCFFSGGSAYTSVALSSVVHVGSSAFYGCSTMAWDNAILSLTNTMVYPQTFYNCKRLSAAISTHAYSVGSSAFYSCATLSTVIMDATAQAIIYSSAFAYCTNLMSLYLLGYPVSLKGVSVFQSTPLSNSTYTGSFGSIFVPESRYSAYLTSQYWSAYSARFVSMTDAEIQEVLDYWNGVINP